MRPSSSLMSPCVVRQVCATPTASDSMGNATRSRPLTECVSTMKCIFSKRSKGRNRIFDPDRPSGQLAGAWIAHAEVNALVQLPAGHYEAFAVTSTTEPCLMCAGAITMSLRGQVDVRYAVDDPIAGGIEAATRSPQGQRRDLRLRRLEHPGFVRFTDALNLAESIRRVPDGVVAAHYRQRRPRLFSCAVELESVLRRFLFTDVALERGLNEAEAVLRNHPDIG